MIEVDFVTLGEASERIEVPSATLRHWTDQLEDYGVHYVKRNNRNERIYYDNDLEVFKYLRDLKKEHGRRTTTQNLASMIAELGESDTFDLRTREDAPLPTEDKSNRVNELLGQEDIQRMMDSDRVKQFMDIIVDRTTKNLKEDLKKEVREEVREEVEGINRQIMESYKRLEEGQKKRDEEMRSNLEENNQTLMESIRQSLENKKSWWQRMFGG